MFEKKAPQPEPQQPTEEDATGLLRIRIENLLNAKNPQTAQHNLEELSDLLDRGKFILKK